MENVHSCPSRLKTTLSPTQHKNAKGYNKFGVAALTILKLHICFESWWGMKVTEQRIVTWTTIVLCFVLLFIRLPESFIDPEIVLSDGASFVLRAKTLGIESLLTPQSGYLQIFSRVIAYLGSLFPLYEKALFTYSAFLVELIVLLYVLSARTQLRYRPLLALTVVLCPFQAHWIHGSAVNAIWLLGLLMLLILIARPCSSRSGSIGDTALLALSAMSNPLILWFLPLFVWRYHRERDRYSFLLLLTAICCWCIQFAVFLLSYRPRSAGTFSTDWEAWIQVLLKLFSSQLIPHALYSPIAVIVIALLFALYAYVLRDSISNGKWTHTVLLLAGLLTCASPLLSYLPEPRVLYWHADRYKYIGAVTLLWVLLQYIHKRSAFSFCAMLLLGLSLYNSLHFLTAATPTMFRTSCGSLLLEAIPEACDKGLTFRWYR